MKDKKINRDKWLTVRLTADELKKIQTGFSSSTKRKFSEYARNILLDKPITIYTRNRSFDDLVAQLILLKNELNAIGNNFNQLVKKMHTMNVDDDIKSWQLFNEKRQQEFLEKMDEIFQKVNSINDAWLRE